ncbi:MAG TPA: histidinol-phosphate transaminase [bacterium]|nr:histidinol-phosphate transaminase [bacterium]HPS28799.1 histidinol-phosphate transaminase [bacterium]
MKGNVSYIAPERALVSSNIKEIQPYATISSRNKILSGESHNKLAPLKLDWNESTLPPSKAVKKAIKDSVENDQNILNWYPELYSNSLRVKLGEYCNRTAEEILVTNGSDDALELICKVFLDPDDQVLVPYPTYTHFITYVQSRGADLRKVELADPFKTDITSILSNVTPDTKLIYIVNPNNPTGVLLSKKQISTICTIASHSIVIVDEAYFEFAGETVMDLIDSNPNLIITRTFSKAWALAGLRIGYLVTNSGLIDQLAKVLNPKSVSVMAQVAAFAALSDKKYMENYVFEVSVSKKMLLDFFVRFNVKAFDSHANYIMVQHPELNTLLEKMESENIFVRDRSSFKNLPNFFRITLGNISQTEELIRRLERVFSSISH